MKVTREEEEELGGEEKMVAGSREVGRVVGGGKGKDGRSTVMVGVRMDAESRELLTWALVKVAQPGDQVIALHVLLPSSSPSSSDGKSCPFVACLAKEFDSVLEVYDGFCNLKQIDLKRKIVRSSSIRKCLVREAMSSSASNLILGVGKHSRSLGFTRYSFAISVAKYCAKRLPVDCRVLAVKNGRVAFQKEVLIPPPVPHFSGVTGGSRSRDGAKHKSSSNSKISSGSNDNSFCLLPNKNYVPDGSHSRTRKSTSTISDAPQRQINLARPSVSIPLQNDCGHSSIQSRKDYALAPFPSQSAENSQSSLRSLLIQDLPEAKPGWPLLKKAALQHNKKMHSEKPKVSVVQWAMRLPNRSSASSAAVHPERKPEKIEVDGGCTKNGVMAAPDIVHSAMLSKEVATIHEKCTSASRSFSYQELATATSNFSKENLIGKGGSGQVYKGCLPDGREVAVKILKQTEGVLKEFLLEIEILTALSHQNIVNLIGFFFENNNPMLVYDFLPKGSLEEKIHGSKFNKDTFGWAKRYNVAIGVAEALNYLHFGSNSRPVIHRDVKSSNILLSDDFRPQLSDFGLATWASSSSSSHITCNDVAGTFGYLAPEYFMFGKVDEKIDVYAFGVVLLELLSGRMPIGQGYPKGQESLVMWAKPILQSGKTKELLDPSLISNYDDDQLDKMILAACLCLMREPRIRPKISMILKLLQGDADALKWARVQVAASDEFEGLDDEVVHPAIDIMSHLNLALLDVEDGADSFSSTDPSLDGSLDSYLQGRWSRFASFD